MMNDGMLSQDEIDALLDVSADDDYQEDLPNETLKKELNVEDYLSSIENDTLGEIGNISFGSSATTLSTLLNQRVEITTPKVSILKKGNLPEEFPFEHVGIQVNYIEGFTGNNLFVIKSIDAAIISDIMLGGDGTNPDNSLNDIHLSAVQEAMNQMMGAAATSMSTIFEKRIDISPPTISSKALDEKGNNEEEILVKVSFQLKVGELIDSNIMQLIPISFAKQLVNQLLNPPINEINAEPPSSKAAVTSEQLEKPSKHEQSNSKSEQSDRDDYVTPQYIGNSIDQENVNIQQATFSNFDQVELNKNEHRNLDMLLDIPLKVTVELGRTNRTIQDILDLSSGSIIELDKLAGEPVDVLVNEKLIAKGEVVVIDENFGVRVTDIVSQTDRLLKLK